MSNNAVAKTLKQLSERRERNIDDLQATIISTSTKIKVLMGELESVDRRLDIQDDKQKAARESYMNALDELSKLRDSSDISDKDMKTTIDKLTVEENKFHDAFGQHAQAQSEAPGKKATIMSKIKELETRLAHGMKTLNKLPKSDRNASNRRLKGGRRRTAKKRRT